MAGFAAGLVAGVTVVACGRSQASKQANPGEANASVEPPAAPDAVATAARTRGLLDDRARAWEPFDYLHDAHAATRCVALASLKATRPPEFEMDWSGMTPQVSNFVARGLEGVAARDLSHAMKMQSISNQILRATSPGQTDGLHTLAASLDAAHQRERKARLDYLLRAVPTSVPTAKNSLSEAIGSRPRTLRERMAASSFESAWDDISQPSSDGTSRRAPSFSKGNYYEKLWREAAANGVPPAFWPRPPQ